MKYKCMKNDTFLSALNQPLTATPSSFGPFLQLTGRVLDRQTRRRILKQNPVITKTSLTPVQLSLLEIRRDPKTIEIEKGGTFLAAIIPLMSPPGLLDLGGGLLGVRQRVDELLVIDEVPLGGRQARQQLVLIELQPLLIVVHLRGGG